MWELGPDLDTILPMDRHANPELPTGKTPKLIHSMTVNTLNFCAFTWTRYRVSGIGLSYLLALPHTLSSEAIDIFQIVISRNSESDSPTVKTYRKTTIPAPDLNDPKTGLTMCLFFQKDHKLIAGYESGHTIVYAMETTVESKNEGDMALWKYKPSYISHAHSQPILSVHGMPDNKLYITTAADSKLVTHQIPRCNSGLQAVVTSEPYNSLNTKHSGQQGLSIRDDGLLLATAGWDSKGRVYKAPIHNLSDKEAKLAKPKEIAVLKWHKEGCYCTAFAHVSSSNGSEHHASDIHRNMEGQLEEEDKVLTRTGSSLMESTSERRDHKAKNTHWLALGSKDGKISLWDIL